MKRFLLIPIALLLLASCSGTAIFYTLENEEKIRDSNNFKSTTPVNRIILFDDSGTDYYVTHGKQLWYSQAGTVQNPWANIPFPADSGLSTHTTVPSIAAFGGRLYAVVSDYDSDSTTALMYINQTTEALTEVFRYNRFNQDGDDFNFYEMYLFPVDTGLYISRINRSWNSLSSDSSSIVDTELYYYPSGDYPTSLDAAHLVTLPGMTGLPFTIKDIVSTKDSEGTGDPVGETYLILNESGSGVDPYSSGKLFKAVNTTPKSFTEESTGQSYSYNRLYYSTGHDILFLSTRTGSRVHPVMYKLYDGSWGSWQSLSGSDDIQFSSFLDISDIQADTILAGTRGDVISDSQTYYNGDGYYELDLTDRSNLALRSNTFTLDTNYNSTDLTNATIMNFLYDSVRDKVYVSTSSYGLWLNMYSADDAARIWYRE